MAGRSQLFRVFLAGVNAPVRLCQEDVERYPGIGALRLLTGEERTEAEDILIGKLAGNDGRAATALAEVGCTRAIPALVERTHPSVPPTMRVFAALALRQLGDDSGRAALVDLLSGQAGSALDRSMAVSLLADFPEPDREFLMRVLAADPDASVRSAAMSAVLKAYHLDDEQTARGEVLWSIAGRVLSPLASVREEALAELQAILAQVENGATREELGLTWRADLQADPLRRFISSVTGEPTPAEEPVAELTAEPEPTRDYVLDGLAELTGRDRAVVDDLLLLYLHRDPRAVRAAARLDVRRAIAPLRELLSSDDQAVADEARAALRDWGMRR